MASIAHLGFAESKMVVCDSMASAKALQPVPESGFSDLLDLRSALDLIDLDELVVALEGPPRVGRSPVSGCVRKSGRGRPAPRRAQGFPRRPMLRAYLASRHLGIGSLSALIVRLNNDPALRSVAGFTDSLPSYATFWRVFDLLAGMPELIARCCDDLLDRLAELAPDLARVVAMDATTIVAYANPNRKYTVRNPDGPADPDATWTKKNSARDPSKQEWVFGYKAHVLADANHDVPLGMVVTTASRNDSPFLPSLLAKLETGHSWFSLAASAAIIADRGYDSRRNNEFVHRNGGVPVIHKRGLPDGKLHDGIYAAEGAPTCLGGRWRMSALFPIPGITCTAARRAVCARRNTAHAVSACDDEARENPEGNIKRFGGGIRRGSAEWKAMDAKRWNVEQVSSRWKEQGRLERHRYFGLRRVSAHAWWLMLMSLVAQLDQALAEARKGRSVG